MRLTLLFSLALSVSLPWAAEAQGNGTPASDHPPALGDSIGNGVFEIVHAGGSSFRVGERVKLSELRDKPVILEFWATWCGPCRIQHAFASDLVKQYGDRVQAFTVLWENSAEGVQEWLERNEPGFPIVVDVGGELASTFWVNFLPRLALLDQHHRLSWDTSHTKDDSITVRLERLVKREP